MASSLIGDNLTVEESLKFLQLNGVEYHEVYFRSLLTARIVKSKKIFNSRVISKIELCKIINRKKK